MWGGHDYIKGHSSKNIHRHHTEETKNKISKGNTGKTSWKKGKCGMPKIPTLCRCGCKEVVWNGRIFLKGHNNRGKKKTLVPKITKRPMGSWWKGKRRIFSKEHKEKISRSGLGRVSWNKGLTKETDERVKQTASKLLGHKGLDGSEHPNWKGGISFLPYCPKFNTNLKEKIRNRDNRTCQLCGTKENGRKLDVHHIHYDKENCNPDLIALCIKCHHKAEQDKVYEQVLMNILNNRGLLFWAHMK